MCATHTDPCWKRAVITFSILSLTSVMAHPQGAMSLCWTQPSFVSLMSQLHIPITIGRCRIKYAVRCMIGEFGVWREGEERRNAGFVSQLIPRCIERAFVWASPEECVLVNRHHTVLPCVPDEWGWGWGEYIQTKLTPRAADFVL